MSSFWKNSIVCVLFVLIIMLFPVSVWAYEVSAEAAAKTPDANPDAKGFYDKMDSFSGWTGNLYKKYNDCKESHYSTSNNSYVDNRDIHYHVSHGGDRWDSGNSKTLRAVIFENGNNLVPSEAKDKWGDKDLEFIGFRNCQLLNDTSWKYWAKAMNGLHLICGFKTNSGVDNDYGKIWAEQMHSQKKKVLWWYVTIPAKPVASAWFSATDLTQSSSREARVIAENWVNFSDYLNGQGYLSSDPTPNSYRYKWTHKAGSPPYLFVNYLTEMNVYEVLPRIIDDSYVQGIGDAFGMAGQDVLDLEDSRVMTYTDAENNPHILEVYKATGEYYYHNIGRLWDPNINIQGFCNDPLNTANSFLNTNGLMPLDAGTTDVEYEYIIGEDTNDPPVEPNQIYPQSCCVVYAREIEAGAGAFVSVAGPGAKLKVYLHENGQVIGSMGKWRDIQQAGTLQVRTKEQTWDLFQAHPEIAISPVYAEYDSVDPNYPTATQAYYEHSSLNYQNKLIPVWVYYASYYHDSNLVTTAETYIPATDSVCPPVTTITSPLDASTYDSGQNIQFRCTTEALGTPPYTYQWESDVDGQLSSSQDFDSNSLTVNCPSQSCECSPDPHIITLTVTDAEGLQSVKAIEVLIQGTCADCSDCADLNNDGTVDFKDLAEFCDAWLILTGQGE